MSDRKLPWLVKAVLRGLVPVIRRAEVLADLTDDYRALRARLPAGRSALWLLRETLSLAGAFGWERIRRAARVTPFLVRDLQQASRSVRRRPIASACAAGMLACALAGVAIANAFATAGLFRPISAVHGDALERLGVVDRNGQNIRRFTFAELEDLKTHLSNEASVAGVNLQPVAVRFGQASRQVLGEVVTASYIDFLDMEMILGRGLADHDDRLGSPPVAIVSESFWRSRLGGHSSIVGAPMTLNTTSVTVIGVTRARGSSAYFGASVDVWITSAAGDAMLNPGWRTNPMDRWWVALALPRSSGPAELGARLDAATASLANELPERWRERRLFAEPGRVLAGSQRGPVATLAGVLAALAGLILLAAAANVGGMLLARAATECRQAALHLAIGSGRAAIVRRRLAEGGIIGTAGGVLAVILYAWARAQMEEITLQPTLTLRLDLPIDLQFVTLLITLGTVTGVLLALGPALWTARLDLTSTLKDGMSRSGTAALPRVRRVLVAIQVALSLALIVGAALFSRSLAVLASADPGFAREGLVAMDFDVDPVVPSTTSTALLAREALERARALPNITGAAMASRAPVDPSTPVSGVRRPGDTAPIAEVTYLVVTDGYLDTVGIPVLRGRDFTRDEADRDADVTIVNETLANRLWPGGDALDRVLVLDEPHRTLRVIGVARNARYRALSESDGLHAYVPTSPQFRLALLSRTRGEPREALLAIQSALDHVGPGLVGFFPRTLDDHLSLELLPGRAAAAAATGLGVIAWVLSAMGLYALVAWFVEVRRKEISVRIALGASRTDVRRLIVTQALTTAIPGAIGGLALSTALAYGARSALIGITPLDVPAVLTGLMAIGGVVIVASYVPARRATRIDPAAALRD